MHFAQWFCIAIALVCVGCLAAVTSVDAATVYRCVGKDRVVAFQDRACSTGSKQGVLDIVSHDPAVSIVVNESERPVRTPRQQSASVRQRRVAEPTSWECRTTTGMVFYRHSRCPASLADGSDSNGRARRLMVSSQGMDRREACRRMRNGARDGNQFDDRVSTYERNLGRDTCRDY